MGIARRQTTGASRRWRGLPAGFAGAAGFVLAVTTALCPVSAAAGRALPTAVRNLHYGEVLFYFYQQDYFDAMTRLLAARSRDRLGPDRAEAELLMGGMELSYGLYDDAQSLFQRLLTTDVPADIRDRAWLHLARMAYERGNYDQALQALKRLSAVDQSHGLEDPRLLHALVQLRAGNAAAAVQQLAPIKPRVPDQAYLRYNLGIARIAAGDIARGIDDLRAVGAMKTDSPELIALRDRSNLAAGYALLRHDQPRQAGEAFKQVRLQGPFSPGALLGAGWASAAAQDYRSALVPWRELAKRPIAEAAAQEGLLAVPYAYGQLGAQQQSAQGYRAAIDAFSSEMRRLDSAEATVRNERWLGRIAEAVARNSIPAGKPDAELPYLQQLLAGPEFRQGAKNLHDLQRLMKNLLGWQQSMDSFDAMLATRRTRYETQLPAAEKALAALDMKALHKRRDELAAKLAAVTPVNAASTLASEKERKALEKLEADARALSQLPINKTTAALRDKQRLLAGVLHWRIETDYARRRWQATRALKELNRTIETTSLRRQQLQAAQVAAREGFQGFRQRIDTQRARVNELLPRVRNLLDRQQQSLRRLALNTMEQRRRRLQAQLAQARFALARIYDSAAKPAGEPKQ